MFAVAFELVVAKTAQNHPKEVTQAYFDIGATLSKYGFERIQGSLYTTQSEDMDIIPAQYWKKLTNTDDIWEARIQFGGNIFRILGFENKGKFIVLTNGFAKKTQKTPKREIELAQQRKKIYLERTN